MRRLVALISCFGCIAFGVACSSEDVQDATDAVRSSAERVAGNASSAAGDVQDNAYIEALKVRDASFGDREQEIAAARAACTELSNGAGLNDTVTKTADETGLNDDKAKTLINIAVPIYCPANVGKLAGN